MPIDPELLKQLRAKRSELQTQLNNIQTLANSATSTSRTRAVQLVTQISEQIDKMNKAEKSGVGLTDLIRTGNSIITNVRQVANGQIPHIVQDFVETHLNKKKKLFSKSTPKFSVRYGVLSLGVKFSVSLDAELKGTSTISTITIKGSATGSATTDVSLAVGVPLPSWIEEYIGSLELSGGARGTLSLKAEASMVLNVKGTTLSGTLNRSTIKCDFNITLYLNVPESVRYAYSLIPDAVLWAVDIETYTLPSQYTYSVGTWNIFNIGIPGGTVSYTIGSTITTSVSGDLTFSWGTDVQRLIKKAQSYLPF